MKIRFIINLVFIIPFTWNLALAQEKNNIDKLDVLIIQGEYNEAISNCLQILQVDSLNAEIYYKLGLAYQNIMFWDKAAENFNKAVKLSPDVKKYSFALAKYYYNTGKFKLSQPIFSTLSDQDSLNWTYAYYLSDMYMQKGMFKAANKIYNRFYKQDSTNLTFLDKIGFCFLRMGDLDTAQVIFEKSLSKNGKNIPALKNLSYIYFKKNMIDTAIYQINKGIEYDSTDIDLYYRRADIYYSQNHHFRCRPDYLKILASGDSSKLVLKRIGIGLAYNNQPMDAIPYLLDAFQKDSIDFEISSHIGQTYYKLKQYDKSINYYNKVLKLLSTFQKQIDYTNLQIADVYRDSSQYDQAIKYYNKNLNSKYTGRICLTIANLYDEKLKDYNNAIQYYQLFLNNLDKNEFVLQPEYLENVKKRLNWIIENKNKKKNTQKK